MGPLQDDELLSGFEGDEETESPKQKESDFVKLRREKNRIEKELKAALPELEELRAYKETSVREQVSGKARTAFTQLGLNEKQADLFLRTHDVAIEVTPDVVKTWAVEYGLAPAEEAASEPEPVREQAFTFTPTAGGASPAGQKRYSTAEFLDLYQRDPNAAMEAKRKGLVDTPAPDSGFARPLG